MVRAFFSRSGNALSAFCCAGESAMGSKPVPAFGAGAGHQILQLLFLEEIENLLRFAKPPGFDEQLGQHAINPGLRLHESRLQFLIEPGDVFADLLIGVHGIEAE